MPGTEEPRVVSVQSAPSPNSEGKAKLKTVTITTDGVKWAVASPDCSILELKELCREILAHFGG